MPRNIPYDYQSIAAPTDPAAGVRRVYYDSTSGQMMVRSSNSQSRPLEGPLIKSGTPVDGDFVTPYDGLLAIDTATKRLYIRVSGSWVPVNADLTSLVLSVLTLANPGRTGATFTAGNTGNNEDTITMQVFRGGTNLVRWQVASNGELDLQPGGDSTVVVGANKFVITASTGDTTVAGNATVSGIIALGTNPAAAGQIRLPNSTNISARNQANGADIALISLNSSNKVVIGGQAPGADGTVLTADAATTGGVKYSAIIDATTTTHGYITADDQKRLTTQSLGNITGSLTIDLSLGDNIRATLTGNISITLTNPVADHDYKFVFAQDGSGSHTITWTTTVKWTGNVTPVATTTASKKDIFVLARDGSDYLGTATLNF